MDFMTPFSATVDLQDGSIPEARLVQQRFLSDMQGMYEDESAEAALKQAVAIAPNAVHAYTTLARFYIQ